MKRPRRRPRVVLPPVPRLDLEGRRAETGPFGDSFVDALWRRGSTLL